MLYIFERLCLYDVDEWNFERNGDENNVFIFFNPEYSSGFILEIFI